LREQLAPFADALDQNRELAVFFFSPYFSNAEKIEALGGLLGCGGTRALLNFLSLLIEKPRMPVIFRARYEYERLWEMRRTGLCPWNHQRDRARSTDHRESLGKTIGERAGRKGHARGARGPDILGGTSSGSATDPRRNLFAIGNWSSCAGSFAQSF